MVTREAAAAEGRSARSVRRAAACRHLPSLVAAVFTLFVAASSFAIENTWGVTSPVGEYELKAAFLYNFAKFVIWPQEAEQSSDSLTLCIVGPDPFGPSLEQVLSGKTVRGRRLEIRRFASAEEVEGCELIFVAESVARDPRDVLAAVRGRGVLTVADSGDFARRGGAINLVEQGNRIGFEINPSAAHREGLVVSSKLLRLATVVGQ